MKTIISVLFLSAAISLTACEKKETNPNVKETQTEQNVKPKMDLHTAVIMDNIQEIKLHIKIGSDLNVAEPSRKSTPLITAAVFGKTEIAKVLIDAGADLNYQNQDGATALHTAAFFCNEDIVELLLKAGADKLIKNAMGFTAKQTLEVPFEKVKEVYEAMKEGLKPIGLKLDLEEIKSKRPKIAAIL